MIASTRARADGPAAPADSKWRIAGGAAFIALWLLASAGWSLMSLIGGVMANDSGSLAPERHVALLGVMICGEILAALAGIPAGLAVFRAPQRRRLLWAFVAMCCGGAALQLYAFLALTSTIPF